LTITTHVSCSHTWTLNSC